MRAEPKCPLRPGDDCTLCEPGATGPEDCPAVYLVMTDPDLRARWVGLRQAERAERAERAARAARAEGAERAGR